MRRIDLQGCENFWDIGGCRCADGTLVKPGMIYRSGRLSDLTDDDVTVLSSLNIRRILDFRSPDEVAERPDRLPGNPGQQVLHVPVGGGGLSKTRVVEVFRRAAAGELDTHAHMTADYRRFPEVLAEDARTVLELLLDPSGYPVLMHCTAGKDRTGFVSALILGLLGCSEERIIEDYLSYRRRDLSADAARYAGSFASYGISVDEQLTYPFLLARRSYIEALLDSIRQQWGTIPEFLAQKAGFSAGRQQHLRELLLA